MKKNKSIKVAQLIADELFAALVGGEFEPHCNPIAKEFKFSKKYGGYLIDASHFSFRLKGEEFEVIVKKNHPVSGKKRIAV